MSTGHRYQLKKFKTAFIYLQILGKNDKINNNLETNFIKYVKKKNYNFNLKLLFCKKTYNKSKQLLDNQNAYSTIY